MSRRKFTETSALSLLWKPSSNSGTNSTFSERFVPKYLWFPFALEQNQHFEDSVFQFFPISSPFWNKLLILTEVCSNFLPFRLYFGTNFSFPERFVPNHLWFPLTLEQALVFGAFCSNQRVMGCATIFPVPHTQKWSTEPFFHILGNEKAPRYLCRPTRILGGFCHLII